MKIKLISTFFIGVVLLFVECNQKGNEQTEHVEAIENTSIEVVENEQYKLTVDTVSVTVDGKHGGRISSLKLGEHEFLTGSEVNATNWGATFWASPQSLWGWPPPSAFDQASYAITVEGDKIVATGQVDTLKTNLQFVKTVSFNKAENAIELNFKIINHNTTAYSAAPWLIARVPAEGLAFFPVDTATAQTSTKFEVNKGADVVWFDFNKDTLNEVKFINNGNEGWVANLVDNYLFIQKFDDVSTDKIAPSEGDVEVYIAPGKTYVELEPQGEYQSIPAGGSIDWTVFWMVKEIDAAEDTFVGSQSLVDLVRQVVKN